MRRKSSRERDIGEATVAALEFEKGDPQPHLHQVPVDRLPRDRAKDAACMKRGRLAQCGHRFQGETLVEAGRDDMLDLLGQPAPRRRDIATSFCPFRGRQVGARGHEDATDERDRSLLYGHGILGAKEA